MKRSTITLTLAGLAATAVLGTTAASASIIGDPATPEQAGYQATGAQFRYVQGTVYLRKASQYSGSVGALGQSVQFWGGGRVYVLGVSDTTTASPYSPAVAVFNNTTHALVDTGSFGAVSYPAGHSVQESIYYNTKTGDLTFTVADLTAATTSSVVKNVGTGISFREVRVGTEYGDTPWQAPASFTPPATKTKVATFTNGRLTKYNGKRFGYAGAFFHTAALTMTGAGSVAEAAPGPLGTGATSFSTYLLP